MPRPLLTGALLLLVVAGAVWPSAAAETWQPFDPFADVERRKAAKLRAQDPPTVKLQPEQSPPTDPAPPTAMRDVIPAPVEKGELAPVMAVDGSELPYELWRGLDVSTIETLFKNIDIPPHSPTLHDLWRRLITADVSPPPGQTANMQFAALRIEALYRSGLIKESAAELSRLAAPQDGVVTLLQARNDLAAGDDRKACDTARKPSTLQGAVPQGLRGQAILFSGYCALLDNDAAGAAVSAGLAREIGIPTSPGLEALEAAPGVKLDLTAAKRYSLIDYRIVARAAPGVTQAAIVPVSEPALLVALALDSSATVETRLQAAEAAARINAFTPADLANGYAALGKKESYDALTRDSTKNSPARRASLYAAAQAEQTPMKKTRAVRALIDDAKRNGLYLQTLIMLAPVMQSIEPQQEISWFAETASEISVASGHLETARRWLTMAKTSGASGLDHWLALVDIADPTAQDRGRTLPALESLAVSGRFEPDALHRLATVLDALDYQIPIPLWDAASRTPQPSAGHLPATGVLPELQASSKKREFGRTVLLALQTLGPGGAESAHLIALNDTIRALKRAGLEADARKLGVEALIASWPRATND